MRLYSIDLLSVKRLWDRWKKRKAERERMKWHAELSNLARMSLNKKADKIEKELVEHAAKKPDGGSNGFINR